MADCDTSDTATESLKTDLDTTDNKEEETAKVEPEKSKKKSAASVGKVEVRLQAAGDAPIMKQKNYNVRADRCFMNICNLLIIYICRLIERKR